MIQNQTRIIGCTIIQYNKKHPRGVFLLRWVAYFFYTVHKMEGDFAFKQLQQRRFLRLIACSLGEN